MAIISGCGCDKEESCSNNITINCGGSGQQTQCQEMRDFLAAHLGQNVVILTAASQSGNTKESTGTIISVGQETVTLQLTQSPFTDQTAIFSICLINEVRLASV